MGSLNLDHVPGEKKIIVPQDFKILNNKDAFTTWSNLRVDPNSESIRKRFNLAEGREAVSVSTFGDCLFNAVSVIVRTKHKPPSIICYTDEQLRDLKFFVSAESDYVIGIDRTFNLGKCFVTTLVYRNLKVVRRESDNHPAFFGPMFLHWDSVFETYCSFFSHTSSRMKSQHIQAEVTIAPEVKIGSDDEKALTQAIDHCFKGAKRYLCTKHIKDNVKYFLQDKIGMPKKEKATVVDKLFGECGLANSDNSFVFDQRAAHLQENLHNYPELIKYLTVNLIPRLGEHVYSLHKGSDLWTNNCCESLNNILKNEIDWSPKKTPELVEKLHGAVKMQHLDLRASLHGTGNYQLFGKYKKYLHSHTAWCAKSKDERDNIFQSFLNDRRKPYSCDKAATVTSTNGKLTIPRTPQIAKKPGQRKRAKAERASKKFRIN